MSGGGLSVRPEAASARTFSNLPFAGLDDGVARWVEALSPSHQRSPGAEESETIALCDCQRDSPFVACCQVVTSLDKTAGILNLFDSGARGRGVVGLSRVIQRRGDAYR